jgi:F-box/WD-40 domain protein 7
MRLFGRRNSGGEAGDAPASPSGGGMASPARGSPPASPAGLPPGALPPPPAAAAGSAPPPPPPLPATPPAHYCCPISMDIMHDPVVCATGMTYNRASITRWLEAGHKTCPSTGQRLRHLELVPNFALRCAIVVRAARPAAAVSSAGLGPRL